MVKWMFISMEKYYLENEIAKPILKIGEPFNIGINLTVYQKCYVSVMLTEIGEMILRL